MSEAPARNGVAAFVQPHRMMADGLPYADVVDVLERAETLDEWCDFWEAKGREYEALGDEALELGLEPTAGEYLWLASMCVHYAAHMAFEDSERRDAGQREKVRVYDRAAPYLVPSAERVGVGVDGITIPGMLRVPVGATGPVPWVVLIGGLESTKEESYLVENRFLANGVATFSFDGPGQGEAYFERRLVPDFERYTSAILDHFAEHPALDGDRVAVFGRSLGGHYALRAAAADDRFRASVCWGGCYDMTDFDAWPPMLKIGFAYVAGRSIEDTREFLLETHTLDGLAERLTAPVLAVQGRHDEIFTMRQVDKFATLPNVEILVEQDGNHCCHNRAHVVRPRMIDWTIRALRA
jgi:2,6-dihydroxypseudooxynicotine hydrolase